MSITPTRAPSFVEQEPSTFWGAVNFALISTWAVVDQAVPKIPDGVSTAIGIALGAWVLVVSFIVRSKVTPVLPAAPDPLPPPVPPVEPPAPTPHP